MSDDTPAPTPAPTPGTTPATELPPADPPVQTPFVPRYREPWVNPAKRTSVIVLGAATAVVLLALGFLLGLGLSGGGHHHDRFGPGRPAGMYGRGYGDGPYGPGGPLPGPGRQRDRHGYGPDHRPHYYGTYVPVQSPSSVSASPAPSHS